MNDNIKRLQDQIKAEKRRIANCKHEPDKPFYNPETVREPYGQRMITQGSDVWYEPQGYHDVKKDRWTRKCIHCGLEEHTYTQKPIITGHEPSF